MGQSKGSVQSKERRIKNFNEVSLGYSKKLTVEESRRCPQCSDPVCVNACPIGINIPGFIRLLREGNIAGAYEVVKQKNTFPSVCGRICSSPCEVACILNEEESPINIRLLERYAADYGRPRQNRRDQIDRKGKKIAIVGSGPAGLSAAGELALKGYQVKVFESLDQPGGVLRYGLPEFRIPKKILNTEIDEIRSLGVEIETNCCIGQTMTIDELKQNNYVAILLTTGAGVPKLIDLPGADLGGVYYGEEFLMRVNQANAKQLNQVLERFPLGDNILIIGSGNTALDCARLCVRLQKQVTVVFRKTIEDMRVRSQEQIFAQEEGVHFEPLLKPLEILADQENFVSGVKCARYDYADVDSSGKWSLIPVPGSDFVMDANTVIIAIGHHPNSFVNKFNKNIKLRADGTLEVDEATGMTTVKGIFAAGNVATNAGPVIGAIASGKKTAEKIHAYLTS